MPFPDSSIQSPSHMPVGSPAGEGQLPYVTMNRSTPSSTPLSVSYQAPPGPNSGDMQRVAPGIPLSQPQQWPTPAGWAAGQQSTQRAPTPGSLQQLQKGMPRPSLQQPAGLQGHHAGLQSLQPGGMQGMPNGAGQAPSFLQHRSTSLSSQQQLLQQQQLSQHLPEQPRQIPPGMMPQSSAGTLSTGLAQPTSTPTPSQQRSAPVQATGGLPASNPLGSMPGRSSGAPSGTGQPRPYGQQLPQQLTRPGGLPQMVAPVPIAGTGVIGAGAMPFTAGMPMGFVNPQQAQAWSALQMQLQAMRPAGQGEGSPLCSCNACHACPRSGGLEHCVMHRSTHAIQLSSKSCLRYTR